MQQPLMFTSSYGNRAPETFAAQFNLAAQHSSPPLNTGRDEISKHNSSLHRDLYAIAEIVSRFFSSIHKNIAFYFTSTSKLLAPVGWCKWRQAHPEFISKHSDTMTLPKDRER